MIISAVLILHQVKIIYISINTNLQDFCYALIHLQGALWFRRCTHHIPNLLRGIDPPQIQSKKKLN